MILALVLIAALVAVNAAYLLLLDRQGARAAADRAADRAERQVLLQRIQAPQEAVFEHATREAPPFAPPPPAFDDDAEFWAARADVSKDDLALALARHELAEAGVRP